MGFQNKCKDFMLTWSQRWLSWQSLFPQKETEIWTVKSRAALNRCWNIEMLYSKCKCKICVRLKLCLSVCLGKFERVIWVVRSDLFSEAWGSIKGRLKFHMKLDKKPKACKSLKCSKDTAECLVWFQMKQSLTSTDVFIPFTFFPWSC